MSGIIIGRVVPIAGSSGGSSGVTPITLAAGASSWRTNSAIVIDRIIVQDSVDLPAFSIGTNPGDTDVFNTAYISAPKATLNLNNAEPAGTTFYFTGITSNTIITIYPK